MTVSDPSLLPGADAAETAAIVTDYYGRIVSANAAAARLLNFSERGMRDRSMLAFFSPGRDRMAGHMRRASEGAAVEEIATLRPRDRRPFAARVHISGGALEPFASLHWVVTPLPATD